MPIRPRWRDRLSRHAAVLPAVALVTASLLVASTFRAEPGTGGAGQPGESGPPGPAPSTVPYTGPDLIGIFTGCNPACDLEVATEGIGRRLTWTDRAVDESAPSLSPDRAKVVFRCAAPPAVEPSGVGSPRPGAPARSAWSRSPTSPTRSPR